MNSQLWLQRYMALLIIFGGLLLILAATLHPFNFAPVDGLTWQSAVDRLDLRLLRSDSWVDIPRNILLFIPLGLGFNALLHTWQVSARGRVIVVGLVGLATTLVVEGLQLLLQLRSPELSDIAANTSGVLLSTLSYQMWRTSRIRGAISHPYALQSYAVLALLPIVGLLVLPPFGLFSDLWRQPALANWDSHYRLAVGNELTGDRPWQGRVDEVIVLDRAATPTEIETFFEESLLPAKAPEGTITHYCIRCEEGLHDLTGFSPPLVSKTSAEGESSLGVKTLTGFTWLESKTPVAGLIQRIAAASAFTLFTVIQPGSAEQSGPARIITLSKDAHNRNFTIGQEGDELVVRLRTLSTGDNGLRPEFRVPDIFQEDTPRRIVVTYAASWLRVYVDSSDNAFSAQLAPEIALVSKMIPVGSWHVAMGASSLAIYRVIYYLLVVGSLLPLGLIPLLWATGPAPRVAIPHLQ